MTHTPTQAEIEAAARAAFKIMPLATESGDAVDFDDAEDWPELREEMMRMARAAITAAYAVRDRWEPIETAPKDGTNILLGWFKDGEEPQVVSGWFEAGIADYRWIDCFNEEANPTHWRPLPSPPEGER